MCTAKDMAEVKQLIEDNKRLMIENDALRTKNIELNELLVRYERVIDNLNDQLDQKEEDGSICEDCGSNMGYGVETGTGLAYCLDCGKYLNEFGHKEGIE